MTTFVEAPTLSRRRRWAVLAVCALSLFVVGLDTTITNVALPAVARGLRVETHALEWVVDGYTLVFASLLITSGALADRWGRRRVFQTGLVVFAASSAACALAPTVGALVAARAAQGVGASMLSPVALAIVVNAMPDPVERARAIGIWASVFGLSMAAGPVVGGVLLGATGWRALFWANVPVVLLALFLTAVLVPDSRATQARRLDLPGQLLLATAVTAAVGALIEGPHAGWDAPVVLAAYLAGAAGAVVFVRVELGRREPLLDVRLFAEPAFTMAVLGAIAVFVALNLSLLLNTLYLQQGRGWSALAAGAATLPMAAAATVCAPLAGVLVGRHGPRRPLLVAGGFTSAGGLGLVAIGPRTDLWVLLLAYLLIGIGFGFANAPITSTAVGALPAARAGVAGAVTSTARQVGAAVGIAIAGGLLSGAAPGDLAHASRPGWLLVGVCGAFLLAVAAASPTPVRASS